MNIEKKRVFLIEIMPTQDQIITSLNRWKMSLLRSLSKGARVSSRWVNYFFSKQFPAWLDTVRQMDRHDWKRFFSDIIHRKEHRKKVLFPLVILLLFTGLLLIIQNNRKTFIPEAEFRRTILGDWDYASDVNQAGMTTQIRKEKNSVSVQVQRENSQIQFKLPLANPSLKVEKNKATYLNQLQNIEVQYEIEPTKLKESIILHSPSSSSEFTSTLLVQNLVAKVNSENLPIFFDSENNYQFHLERPFAEDAAGNKTFDLKYVLKPKTTAIETNPFQQKGDYRDNLLKLETLRDVQVNTNEYDLVVIVDPEWLSAPERQYPILIDPTITHDTTAEFSVGTFNRVTDTGSGSAPILQAYYQELATDQSTVGLWHMNEASGTVIDSSGRANNGTATGTTVVSGLFGNARSCDGVTDDIAIADNDSLDPPQITIEAWIKPDTVHLGNFVNKGDNLGYRFRVHGSGYLQFFDRGGTNFINTSGSFTYSAGAWLHAAATGDASGLKIYANGNLVASNNVAYGGPNTATPLEFCEYGTNQEMFDGTIDEIRISNIARTPEEIKASASRRPYSLYTSPVIDLGTNENEWSSFQKLSWTENGTKTGNGETLYSSTNLIAQWDLNEGSNVTAATNGGSCGTSCNGTLANITGTASLDSFPASGWTSHSAWGQGAIMFDGTDDRVSMGDPSALDFSGSFTLSTWIKTTQLPAALNYPAIAGKGFLQGSVNGYGIFLNGDVSGEAYCQVRNSGTVSSISGGRVNDGLWHHITCVRDHSTDTTYIYVDGQLKNSNTTALPAGYASDRPFGIGMRSSDTGTTWGFPFQGSIDSVAAYSRALTASEILSNYQATNVQFQTRGGTDSTPDDGTWEAWKPYTNEVPLKTFDETYLFNTTDAGLVDYWPMDESVDNSCSGGTNDVCDKKGSNDMAVTGSLIKIIDGKFAKGRYFPGGVTSDYISKSSFSSFPTTAITTEFWIKTTDITDGILSYASTTSDNDWLVYDSSNLKIYRGAAGFLTTNIAVNDGLWHHIAVTWDSSNGNVQLYKDGIEVYVGSLAVGTPITGSGTLMLGQEQDSVGGGLDATQALVGSLDEVRIYNTILSPETIRQHFLEGSTKPEYLNSFISTVIKKEGTGSQKITTGFAGLDASTIGLWHLEETGGTGAYIKDSSVNAHHGTPTGATVLNGKVGKARNFNGTSHFIEIADHNNLDLTNTFTLEAWVYRNADNGTFERIISKSDTTSYDYWMQVNPTDIIQCGVLIGAGTARYIDGVATIPLGQWTHVACTFDSSNNWVLYVNGAVDSSTSLGAAGPARTSTRNLQFGRLGSGGAFSYNFNGRIDEVRISSTTRSANDIADSYRLGRDHYTNYTLPASEDLSDETVIPFYIAADRPGTYLSLMLGESPFSNYQKDSDTVGLWHLEERNGSGAYLRDVSVYANNGTPTGTTFSQGKIGKGRYFNGTTDIVTIPNSTSLNINGGGSAITIDFWFNPATLVPTWQTLVYKNTGGADCSGTGCSDRQFSMYLNTTGYIHFTATSVAGTGVAQTNANSPASVIQTNRWYHVAGVVDSTNQVMKTYVNGQEMASSAFSNTGIRSANGNLFLGATTGTSSFFNGYMDEVRISNTARSAEEIRQIYDIGKRTHNVTIDFGALLDSGNLIANSADTSFTVDATQYGLNSKGSNLYAGDTIIIQENYDGTEYLAQGSVDSVNLSTGAVTVASWDSGSTFPAGGFTVNANVFKWQREFFDISGGRTDQRNTTSLLSLRVSDGNEGRTVWLDDVKAAGNYLTTPLGSSITTTTGKRYVQYRTLFTSSDAFVSASLSSVTTDAFGAGDTAGSGRCYLEEDPHDESLTLHWTDSATNEIAYEIQRRINGGDWQPVDMTSPNATAYSDTNVAQGNTYQYQVRKVTDDGGTGTWCTTSVVDLGVGSFQMEGLQIEGIQIN